MAFYFERIKHVKDLPHRIVELLTTPPEGATEPFWKKVNTGSYEEEGYILHSKGSNGNDDIYIQIKQDAFSTNRYNKIGFRTMENYIPHEIDGIAGQMINPYQYFLYCFYAERTSNDDNGSYLLEYYPVDIVLNFDKDKIIFIAKGYTNIKGQYYEQIYYGNTGFVYIGKINSLMTEVYCPLTMFSAIYNMKIINQGEGDPNFFSRIRMIDYKTNKNEICNFKIASVYPSIIENQQIFLQPMYIERNGTKDIIGYIDYVYPIYLNHKEFNDFEQFQIGEKRFMIFNVSKRKIYQSSMLPSNCQWLAVEIIE